MSRLARPYPSRVYEKNLNKIHPKNGFGTFCGILVDLGPVFYSVSGFCTERLVAYFSEGF